MFQNTEQSPQFPRASGRGRENNTAVFDRANLVVSRNNLQTLGGGGGHSGGLSCLHPFFFFLNSIGEDSCLLEWKGNE